MYQYIIGGTALLFVGSCIGYFFLAASFMGYPHRCKKHGWQGSGLCLQWDDEWSGAADIKMVPCNKKTEKNQ